MKIPFHCLEVFQFYFLIGRQGRVSPESWKMGEVLRNVQFARKMHPRFSDTNAGNKTKKKKKRTKTRLMLIISESKKRNSGTVEAILGTSMT